LSTTAATSHSESLANVAENLKRGLPRLHDLPEFKKLKKGAPIALAGGGPSRARTIDELRSFRRIMAAGSAHDYLRSKDIDLAYCAVCDPDKLSANYLKNTSPTTVYLVASQCHPAVFEA